MSESCDLATFASQMLSKTHTHTYSYAFLWLTLYSEHYLELVYVTHIIIPRLRKYHLRPSDHSYQHLRSPEIARTLGISYHLFIILLQSE